MLQFGERCKWEIESVFGGLTERNNIPAKKKKRFTSVPKFGVG